MRRSSQFTTLVATAAVAMLALTGCSASPAKETATGKHVAYLWAVGAADASLVTSENASFLELSGVESVITRFSDRPIREASEVDLRDFLGRWEGRFAEDPPNAVLSYQNEEGAAPVQVVVELSRPRYDEEASRIVFATEIIESTPDKLDGANHPVATPTPALPAHTGPVSVFIDSVGPAVTLSTVATIDAATTSSMQASMDLETALIAVQLDRANRLEDQLRSQLDAIQVKNNQISELNNALAAVVAALNTTKPNTEDDELLEESVTATVEAALMEYRITVPSPANFGNYKALSQEIKAEINDHLNLQQMDVLELQSSSTKYSEAHEAMTDFIKKMDDNRTQILRNL